MNRLLKSVVARAIRLFLLLSFRIIGFRCLQIGNCRFWGPQQFLNECRDASARISELDPEVYDGITRQPFVFWYHKEALSDDRLNRMFSIPQAYVAWKGLGVIARLVYARFLVHTVGIGVYRENEPAQLHNLARSSTAAWLSKHDFPRQLQEPFEKFVLRNG